MATLSKVLGDKYMDKFFTYAPPASISADTVKKARLAVFEAQEKFKLEQSRHSLATVLSCLNNIEDDVWQSLQDMEEDQWTKFVIPKGEYAGTWMKRFAKYVRIKSNNEHNVTQEVAGVIGPIIMAEKGASKLNFIIKEWCDWQPGMFNDDGSCWWGDYNNAREGLEDSGGGAVLFYDEDVARFHYDKYGLGRCWVYPQENNLGKRIFIFNGYHVDRKVYLIHMARALSSILGWNYVPVKLDVNDAYINNDRGFLLAPYDIAPTKGHEYYSLSFAKAKPKTWWCDWHEGEIEYEDDVYHIDGHTVCRYCRDDNFFYCENCDEWRQNDRGHRIMDGDCTLSNCGWRHYEDLCDDCYEEFCNEHKRCDECERWVHKYDYFSTHVHGRSGIVWSRDWLQRVSMRPYEPIMFWGMEFTWVLGARSYTDWLCMDCWLDKEINYHNNSEAR